jgi:protein-S-isoprenylcysteine O-methyltransferase Ste14
MAKVGRWWFQRRSVSPIPLFLLLAVLPPNFTVGRPFFVALCVGIAAAEALRVYAVGYAGSATRTRGDSVPELVHAGPYRYVRNPLYVANIAMYTMAGLLFGFSYLSVLIFVYACVQYRFIVAFEEETLSRLFGGPYLHYRKRVPAWWPASSPQVPASRHPFHLGRALRSERSTFFSMGLMALLYLAKNHFR